MKLSFKKDLDLPGTDSGFGVHPITENGERIEGVIACIVETAHEKITTMTIKVQVWETGVEKAERSQEKKS